MFAIIIKTFCILTAAFFGGMLLKDCRNTDLRQESGNVATAAGIGCLVNFLDTLGIGSFATSTYLLRICKQVPDRLLPGTLNAMCILPTFLEAFIFISFIEVDYVTLLCMVTAASTGGWLGGKFVSRLPEQKIRLSMAIALLIPATSMLLHILNWYPAPHDSAIGLTGIKLIIATVISFIVGSLVSVGIGFYAPCLALVYILGMSAKAAFPIMMCAAATSSTFATYKFMQANAYNKKVTLAMGSAGMIGVLVAAYIVKSLPLNILTWVVTAVIYYTAASLFIAFYKQRRR